MSVVTRAASLEPTPTTISKRRVRTTAPAVVLCPGYHGHNVARTLGRLGVRVYGIHQDGASPAARSRFWRKNFVWDFAHSPADATLARLLQIAAQLGAGTSATGGNREDDQRPVLIATDDDSRLFIVDHAAALRTAFRFPEPPPGLVRALSSKKAMYALCKEHGIPVAETYFPRSRDEVAAYAETARFPIMVKGIDTLALQRRVGVKMLLAHDAAELLRHYDTLEDPRVNHPPTASAQATAETDEMIEPVEPSVMLQEFLAGGSRTLWMFDGYFDADSRALFGMTGQKIREYPANVGRTSLGVCLPNPTVAQQSVSFMQALGYRGPLDLDYKYDERTGEYKLIDVNPRLGATFRLFVDSVDLDVARALYLDLTGQSVLAGQPRPGRKWMVENFEALCVPTYLRQERQSLSAWLRSYRGLAEACWFAPDDPAPFLALAPHSVRWAFARWRRRHT